MLTGRAWAVLAGSALVWAASRILGVPDLHMVSVGLLALVPLAALLVRFTPHDLTAVRRVSTRRAFVGTRIHVEIEVRNRARRRTAMLLAEDHRSAELGPPARGVLGEIRAGTHGVLRYDLVPSARGRYGLGPLAVLASDPFDLVRRRMQFDLRHDLIVFPEVEDIRGGRRLTPLGGAGEASTRQLFRAAEEFYTMRTYEEGDDLRRIHWPSVARTGELMIRQDESARRAAAAVLLDNRGSGLAADAPSFERAISAAASIGALFLRTGFRLHLGTADRSPDAMELDRFLEILALARPSGERQIAPSLSRLAGGVAGGGALVVVTGLLDPGDATTLARLGAAAGSKLVLMVSPSDRSEPSPRAREAREQAIDTARRILGRSGWDVLTLGPDQRLGEVWPRRAARIAASS